MSLVFVASALGTFTPTQSGALATIKYELCRVAQREGIEPFVIARRCDAASFDWPRTILLDYPRVPESGPLWKLARAESKLLGWQYPGQRVYAQRMARVIADHGLQNLPLVIINNPDTAIYLRRRFPQAFIAHWFQNQTEFRPRVRAQFASAVNAAFAVSDFTSRWTEEYFGFAPGSVPTLYNAVDSAHFTPADSNEKVLTPVINFVGRTGQEKAPDLLLRAALMLSETRRDFSIQITGSNHWDHFEMDVYQRELKALSDQLQARGIAVHFTGHIGRADLPAVLRRAHINVVPSRWDEPFGLVTLEGMACGLATVASRTGGTPEVVGEAALLFERDDVSGLAAHLHTLLSDCDLRREYSRRGVERARLFSWERTWRRLKQLLPLNTPPAHT